MQSKKKKSKNCSANPSLIVLGKNFPLKLKNSAKIFASKDLRDVTPPILENFV